MPSIQKHRRFAVMGCPRVGKTSLITRLVDGPPSDQYLPTVENITDTVIKVDGTEFECEIVDTAGQDEFSLLRTEHFIGVHGYMIVFSIISRQTLHTAKIIIDKILESLAVDHASIILVANMRDKAGERQVQEKEIEELAATYKCLWYETSARDGTNVKTAFQSLVREVEKVKNPPPETANATRCLVM